MKKYQNLLNVAVTCASNSVNMPWSISRQCQSFYHQFYSVNLTDLVIMMPWLFLFWLSNEVQVFVIENDNFKDPLHLPPQPITQYFSIPLLNVMIRAKHHLTFFLYNYQAPPFALFAYENGLYLVWTVNCMKHNWKCNSGVNVWGELSSVGLWMASLF